MSTIFVVPNNEGLKKLIANLNQVTGENIRTNEVLMVITQNGAGDLMQKILEASGLQFHVLPEEQKPQVAEKAKVAPVEKKPRVFVQRPAVPEGELPRCANCQQPFQPLKKDQTHCSKPECQKARRKAYMATYHAQQAQKEAEPPQSPAPFEEPLPTSTSTEDTPAEE